MAAYLICQLCLCGVFVSLGPAGCTEAASSKEDNKLCGPVIHLYGCSCIDPLSETDVIILFDGLFDWCVIKLYSELQKCGNSSRDHFGIRP